MDSSQDQAHLLSPLETPGDLLELLSPGSVLVAVLPDHLDPGPVVAGFSLVHPDRCILLTSTAPEAGLEFLSLAGARSAVSAEKIARKAKGHHTLLMELTGGLGPWANHPSHVEKFLETVTRDCVRQRMRLVCVIARRFLTPPQWSGMRDRATFVLDFFTAGPWLYCQFLAARGINDTSMFLPRPVRLSSRSFQLGRPLLPPPGKEETGVDAAAELYRQAFSGAGEGMVLFDPRGGYREANRKALEILGLESDPFLRVPFQELFSHGSLRKALRGLILLRKRVRYAGELEIVRPGGRRATVAVTGTALGVHLAVAVLRDISAEHRKQTDVRREAGDAVRMAEAAPFPQAVFVARKLSWANAEFRGLFAQLLAENRTPTLHQVLGMPLAGAVRQLLSVTEERGPLGQRVREAEITLPGGSRRNADLVGTRVSAAGRRALLLTIFDTTESHVRVRELTEDLRAFRSVAGSDAAPAAVVRKNTVVWANRGFAALLGYPSPEDLVGKDVTVCLVPRDRNSIPARLSADGLEDGEVSVFEYSALSSSGKPVRVEASTQRIDFRGEAAGLTFHRNVTGKLKSTGELRQRLDEAVRLERIAAECRHLPDPDAFAAAAVDASLRHLGFDAGVIYLRDESGFSLSARAVRGMPEQAMVPLAVQPMQEGVTGFVARTLEPLHLNIAAYPAHLPYRALFETAGFATVVYLPLSAGESMRGILLLCSAKAIDPTDLSPSFLGAVAAALGSGLDLAIQFQSLLRSETLYRTIVGSVPDLTYSTSSTGALVMLAPQVEKLLQIPPSEFIRNPDLWRQCVHPDDRIVYSGRMGGQAEGANGGELVYRMLPKGKASYRWVRDGFTYRRDAAGALVAVDGIVVDITAQINRNEEQSAAGRGEIDAVESLQDGLVIMDRELKVKAWNKAMERITGLRRESVAGMTLETAGEHQLFEVLQAAAECALEGERVNVHDVPLQHGGQEQFFWLRCSPVHDPLGALTGVVASVSEVTARKRLAGELAQSESTLRSVIDSMGDALIMTDLEGEIREVNREFTRITGYGRTEVLGLRLPYPWLDEDSMGNIVAWVSALREKQDLRDFDMTWRRKDGFRLAISLNTTLLRNAGGDPIAMLNIARNISERKALADELASKNRHIEMMNRIISAANATLDVTKVFEAVAGEAAAMIPCDVIALEVLTGDRESLELRACSRRDGEAGALPGTVRPLKHSTAAGVVASGEPAVFLDLAEPVAGGEVLHAAAGIRSCMSIPVMLNERVIGALEVGSREPGVYSRRDVALLQPIADQLGPALQNALLYTEVQDHMAQIRSLYELGKGLTGAVDTESILAHVAAGTAVTVKYDRMVFASASRDAGLVPVLAVEGGTHPGRPCTPTESEAAFLRNHAEALLQGSSVKGEHAAILAAPVRGKEQIHGAMLLLRDAGPAFRDADLRLLESIATLSGIALDRALLFEDTVAKSAEIEKRNRELDDFSYVVSHDLKEPLITIEGYSTMVGRDFGDRLDAAGKEYLRSIAAATDRMKRLIDDLLLLSRVGRTAAEQGPVGMREVLRAVLRDLEYTLSERHARVVIPQELPVVRYDATQLGLVFRNLISNGIKFNRSDEPVVAITVREEKVEFVVSLADNGIGIPPEYREKIFALFQRLHRAEEYPGTGAGLSIVRKIVERHRGRVWVASEADLGTTFSFTIPK